MTSNSSSKPPSAANLCVAGVLFTQLLLCLGGLEARAAGPQPMGKITPAIHWATPGAIRYGTALNGRVLNAWASGAVAGTFVYTPAAGTVLGAGTQTLSVTFTPADTADYNAVSTTVQLTVVKAVLTVAAYNFTPTYGTYGEPIPPLRYSITGFVNGDGMSAISGAPQVTTTAVEGSPVGQYPITPALGTLAAANYSFTFQPGTLSITPAPLFVHAYDDYGLPYGVVIPPLEYSITGFRNGETQSVVSGAPIVTTTAEVGSAPGAYPITVTMGTLSAPNYVFELFGATLTIVKQTPHVVWATPAAVSYGTVLGAAQLDATQRLPGTFAYTPAAGTVPPVGVDTLSVTFTPADTTDYVPATVTVPLTVNKAVPQIVWPAPRRITQGTALSATQLDATASVPGTFAYTPPAGTVLAMGSDPLSVVFTPTDTTDYTSATAAVRIEVTAPVAATTTTLTVSSGGSPVVKVSSGSMVTLTAAVAAGSTAVTPGTVNFCDAVAAYCTDIHLLGTAQLTAAGTASINLRPAVGSHSYKAVFVQTGSDGASASAAASLRVTGKYASEAVIADCSFNYEYPLFCEASVEGFGSVAPTGKIKFIETSNGNADLGTVDLAAGVAGLNFVNTSNAAVGPRPVAIAVGDFNGDGYPDMAVANSTTANVSVLLGKGDGTFTAAASPATGTTPEAVAVGDFNGDGVPDLAVANSGDGTVTVLLGKGDGTFTAAESPDAGKGADAVAVGDFNGDGILDLAVANAGSADVTVLLGNGDGTFTAAASAETAANPESIAVGDFNGDGIPDLAVGDSGEGTLTILLGNGDGTFTVAAQSPALSCCAFGAVRTIAVGDFRGIGILDLAVIADFNLGYVLLGNGDGTFQAPAGLPGPHYIPFPAAIAVGDFNGDGIADLAVDDDSDESVDVLLGKGDGTFTLAATAFPEVIPASLAVADFNGQGVSDVADLGMFGSVSVWVATNQTVAMGVNNLTRPQYPGSTVAVKYSGDNRYTGSVSGSTTAYAGAHQGETPAGPKR